MCSTWPQNAAEKWIVHFPEERRIWSYGSGYGGNALLGKKCFALRIASVMAREEGWLAEHMLIVGITNPDGIKKYIAAAFPSACGKTNLAMMSSKLPGWKLECIGDDIAWMRINESDGRLYATNPEAGFFGVAPGTSMKSNPNAMLSIKSNVIFTNVAMTTDGDVWWEGMTDDTPQSLTSWLRTERYPDSGYDAAHPNSRFTVSAAQCPVIDPAWESPEGVPIDAIVFGGRRSTTAPLVYEARSWDEGVFIGASMTSETTAAAAGKRGVLRNDPFAMRPFCGYNMADYFSHWLTFKNRTNPDKLPKVFHVNWFRKNTQGKFVWPGFGDNIRVLEWILNRASTDTMDNAVDSLIGYIPSENSINTKDTNVDNDAMKTLLHIDSNEWVAEAKRTREFFNTFGDRIPHELVKRLDVLQSAAEEQSQITPPPHLQK